MPELLSAVAERAKMRCGIERVNECGADEAFVRREIFQLTVDQREEFFFERRFSQARVVPNRRDCVVDFFFEERQRDIFFGSKVIEDRAFSDAGFAGDGFGRGGVEALCLKQSQRRFDDATLDRVLVLRTFTRDMLLRLARARFRS